MAPDKLSSSADNDWMQWRIHLIKETEAQGKKLDILVTQMATISGAKIIDRMENIEKKVAINCNNITELSTTLKSSSAKWGALGSLIILALTALGLLIRG